MAYQDSNKINLPLALASSTAPWWDLHPHATRPTLSASSRNNTSSSALNLWETHNNFNSFQCDHEDISISASNHSTLMLDETSHRFDGTPSSNYITRDSVTDNWSQLIRAGVGGNQDICIDEMGENLPNALSLKRFSSGVFELPSACSEYLRKTDAPHHEKWAEINEDQYNKTVTNDFFTNDLSTNSSDGYQRDSNSIKNNENQGLLNMLSSSDIVSSWSIAPPDQSQMMQHIVPQPCNNSIPSIDQYLQPDISSDQTKQSFLYQSHLFDMGHIAIFDSENSGLKYQARLENDQCVGSEKVGSISATLSSTASFVNTNEVGYRTTGGQWRPKEINMLAQHGYAPSVINPSSNSLSRFSSKPLLRSLSLLESRKQRGTLGNSSMIKGCMGKGEFRTEGKKQHSDDSLQNSISLKKHKRNNTRSNPSTSSSPAKMTSTRSPKGKVEAEKLSALQQIVSPYGKTDTASILQEAIGFIRRHQQNVQLQSNAFLKSNVNKLQEARGCVDRKGERSNGLDLKSKGLCLFPISGIPQHIKEDNSGLDDWPAYRGFLYR